MKRLKIIGNFGPSGTKVIDHDTGEEIPNVRKVTWIHEAGHAPQCVIELVGVTLESEAAGNVVTQDLVKTLTDIMGCGPSNG